MGGLFGGGGNSTTTQRSEIPNELKPLFNSTVPQIQALQNALPISSPRFTQFQPRQIAGFTPVQQFAFGLAERLPMPTAGLTNLLNLNTPVAQVANSASVAPLISRPAVQSSLDFLGSQFGATPQQVRLPDPRPIPDVSQFLGSLPVTQTGTFEAPIPAPRAAPGTQVTLPNSTPAGPTNLPVQTQDVPSLPSFTVQDPAPVPQQVANVPINQPPPSAIPPAGSLPPFQPQAPQSPLGIDPFVPVVPEPIPIRSPQQPGAAPGAGSAAPARPQPVGITDAFTTDGGQIRVPNTPEWILRASSMSSLNESDMSAAATAVAIAQATGQAPPA